MNNLFNAWMKIKMRTLSKEKVFNALKKVIQWIIRAKDFFLELPPGFLEYRQAIVSKDPNFNYLENEYFKRHVLPYNKRSLTNPSLLKTTQVLVNDNIGSSFKVNPSTGLPMIGSYDAGGSPFGFNYHRSLSSHMMNNFNHTNTTRPFDYWR